jgi:bzd-type benzoyl-CoA reductase Q subunit
MAEEEKKEFWRWDETNWANKDIDWRAGKVISAGCDVGSVSSQAVVMVDGELFASANTRTGYNSPESALNVMNWALEATDGMKIEDINFTVGTGYGRVKVPFSNKAITEIACHARGANFMYGPSVRTVMDMGGQDLKAIRCDERGKVLSFLMNEKCAAGTGRGMEVIADLLQVPVVEVGDRSFDVEEEPDPVSTTCVLFAKAEMLGLLKKGYTVNKALAAYCSAMSYRVFTMIKEVDVVEDFVITGGIAKNRGIVERLEDHLGLKSLKTDVDYQLAGAIGGALFGKVLYEKKMKK